MNRYSYFKSLVMQRGMKLKTAAEKLGTTPQVLRNTLLGYGVSAEKAAPVVVALKRDYPELETKYPFLPLQ